jgi:glycosyltransferase involved in cell wall biosynthesis
MAHMTDRPVVALDATPLIGVETGVGRYTRELGHALDAQGVEVRRFAYALKGDNVPGVKRVRIPARLVQSSWRRWNRPTIRPLAGRVDIVHGTNFVLPALDEERGVVTIHDLSYLDDRVFPGGERLRDLVPWSLERAAATIVPTETIRGELLEAYPDTAGRVHVTPEGVSSVFFGATPLAEGALLSMGIRPPFALAVGTLAPRKNLTTLLRAWSIARPALEGWTLVLAGPSGWGPQLPETPGVVLTGWVGDETLPGLLAAADAFCYPSLYEGFGLPPLEAMAAGTAALVGRYSVAPEVLGDAALVVDPLDPEAMADGLVRIGTDGSFRRRLSMAGKARAVGYTWTRTARLTRDVYKAALGG